LVRHGHLPEARDRDRHRSGCRALSSGSRPRWRWRRAHPLLIGDFAALRAPVKEPSSLRKNLETEPLFSQAGGRCFWRWIELWSLRSAVDYAATSLGIRIRL
jgi:hypothetical protein